MERSFRVEQFQYAVWASLYIYILRYRNSILRVKKSAVPCNLFAIIQPIVECCQEPANFPDGEQFCELFCNNQSEKIRTADFLCFLSGCLSPRIIGLVWYFRGFFVNPRSLPCEIIMIPLLVYQCGIFSITDTKIINF